jgi:non-canonical purine NTP pyrophosphatase (RdgB/HAM1 family)
MKIPTFITGNENKAKYLSNHLGLDLPHQKIDLDEIQSLDLKEVVTHKVKQAYSLIQKPVLVQDVSLEFVCLGKLPGTFIRFFVDTLPFEKICKLIPVTERDAIARVVYGYYDGNILKLFEGGLHGKISLEPRGSAGFGWDKIFIPDGYEQTRAEMSKEDDEKTYCMLHPFEELRNFLNQ